MRVKNMLLERSILRQAFRPVVHLLDRYLVEEKIRSLPNLVPHTNISEQDVFLIGYPHSGQTWFRTLVAGVLYGLDFDYMPYAVVGDLVPDYARPYYRRYSTPMVFNSYDLPQPTYKRVVYLLRDGRQVIVSCYHQMNAARGRTGRARDFLKVVQGRHSAYPRPTRWHEHVEAWLANPYRAQLLIIRYEELAQDAVNQLQRFCQFVGVERDRPLLEQVVQQVSVPRRREQIQHQGPGELMGDLRLKDQPVVGRGEEGGHQVEMPSQILDVFLRDAGDTLRKLGYL